MTDDAPSPTTRIPVPDPAADEPDPGLARRDGTRGGRNRGHRAVVGSTGRPAACAERTGPTRGTSRSDRDEATARWPRSRSNGIDPVRARRAGARAVVLRRADPWVRPAGRPLEPALAGRPHRHRPVGRRGVDAPRIAVTGWVPGDGSAADRLSLADWRRRVSTLYAEVRAMAATDPATALAHGAPSASGCSASIPSRRSRRPPGPTSGRSTSITTRGFASTPSWSPRRRRNPALPLELPNSGADTLSFGRIGRVRLPFPDGDATAAVGVLDGRVRGWPVHPVP